MTSKCKNCGASIRWVDLPTGKTVPLDERPFTAYLLDADGTIKGSQKAKPAQVRRCHFDTCDPHGRVARSKKR